MLSKAFSKRLLSKKASFPTFSFSTTLNVQEALKSLNPFGAPVNKYVEHTTRSYHPDTLEDFWKEQAKLLDWYKEPTIILDKSNPPFFRWFKDGVMNTSYNCLDRHVHRGAANDVALIYESPLTNVSSKHTYGEMLDLVSRFANVLQRQGVQKGDRVVIYMPMIPEALVAMQACARIGATHSVVFGGFSGKELASRLTDAKPKLIVTASCGIEPGKIIDYKPMIDEAIQISGMHDIKRVVVQRDQYKVALKKGSEFEFYDELAKAKAIEPVPLSANDYLYILYTSGTTGTPKGVVRENGGNAVALAYCEKYILDIGRNDVFFSATDIGWVTGHSYLAYGPWLAGAATVLYEGKPVKTPDAGSVWRICEKYGAKGFYTSPTAIRSIIKDDPNAEHLKRADLSNLRTLLSVGEKLDAASFNWIQKNIPDSCLLIDNYFQTETGWFISTNYKNLHTFQNKPGSAGKPTPGNNVVILDENGNPVPAGTTGAICLKYPTPPSFVSTLYNNDEGFVKKYASRYPGYYFTEDAGFIDNEGYLHVLSRLDDVINTAGHRLSTSQIEEVLTFHEDVVEAACVGVHEKIKGEIPVGFVVLKSGVNRDLKQIEKECIKKVRDEIGPVASFKFCMVVDKLPKTRSGKIVRKVLRQISNGEEPVLPPTIDDPNVVNGIKKTIEEHGLGVKGFECAA